MSMKRKLSFDYNENLISGNKIAKTSQGNQTILIGASKGLQVNLRNECLTKSAQTRWVSSSKSINVHRCKPQYQFRLLMFQGTLVVKLERPKLVMTRMFQNC